MKSYQENKKLEKFLFEEMLLLIRYLEQTEFNGREPYDASESLAERKWLPGFARMLWIQVSRLSPTHVSRFFREKKKYTKAMALFAHAFLILYKNTNEERYKEQAIAFLNWLEENRSRQSENFSLGTFYSIAMKGYAATEDTPSPLITAMAVEAFMSAYEILGEIKYLDMAASGVNYFLIELPQRRVSNEHVYFVYHPNNPKFIPNLPAVLCGTLARFFRLSGNQNKFQTVIHNLNYIVSHQRPDGAWLYAETAPYIDNFHTGFILEGLLKFELFSGDKRFRESLNRGVNYWRSNLFRKSGKPIHRKLAGFPSNADSLLTRIDARDCAQSLVLLSYLQPEYIEMLQTILLWTVQKFKSKQGYFYYQQLPMYKLKGPFIGTQAWMLYGLTRVWDSIICLNQGED